jgi:hypothetical protein
MRVFEVIPTFEMFVNDKLFINCRKFHNLSNYYSYLDYTSNIVLNNDVEHNDYISNNENYLSLINVDKYPKWFRKSIINDEFANDDKKAMTKRRLLVKLAKKTAQ